MSWCLLNLASNPEIQEKARQEVLAELPDDEPLTFESLEKLSFCGNVIKETLRYWIVQALHLYIPPFYIL